MALYRFLFAPALLAVALVAGSGERARPTAAPGVTAAPPDRAASADTGVAPAAARAVAVKPPPRPLTRAERARPHPSR
jgi:hypothetical protein